MDTQRANESTATKPAAGFLPRPSPLTDPRIQSAVIGLVLLFVVWTGTGMLIQAEFRTARSNAATSTVSLAVTYEAQVLRALREVDLTLKFLQYAAETGATPAGTAPLLPALAARGLLPPDFLFTVSIANADGSLVESTRDPGLATVAGLDWFEGQRQFDAFLISQALLDEATQTWLLHFSRRLADANGGFAGIAFLTVDAAFFVSGYESADLGTNGVLGILGSDGNFRARRSGETIDYGGTIDYGAALTPLDAIAAAVRSNQWDSVSRYTSVRELFGFPLAVVVGLAEEEQLGGARQRGQALVLQALLLSVVLIGAVALLGRLNWQLQRSRLALVAEQMAHARQIEYFAYHDALTGLANRSLFNRLLAHAFKQAQRNSRSFSLLFMDLDRFKVINDTLGHDAGDALLIEVAKRLTSATRASDTVARLGGDEFVVLLPEQNAPEQLTRVATRILDAVRLPFQLGDQELRVTVSIGISTYPQDGLDEQTLTKSADIAMYNAKKAGRNALQFYSAELQAESLEHRALEANLRLALERGELRLFYQARRNVRDGHFTGVEALLRWQHPELGLVLPAHFLPIAEKTGLIVPIGRWVIETACRQAVAWHGNGSGLQSMSVNLSAREFYDEELPTALAAILQRSGIEPRRLNLEITENLLLSDFDNALRILTSLTELGVNVSLDNFGAGYASLAMLKQVRLDTIKVDEAFIRDITRNPADRELMEAVITMARALGLRVVAEGVETPEQASFLGANACDEIQGNYVSGVLPADEMTTFLEGHAR